MAPRKFAQRALPSSENQGDDGKKAKNTHADKPTIPLTICAMCGVKVPQVIAHFFFIFKFTEGFVGV